MSVALDWLIIGGGIHGVHIAARLLGDVGVSPDRLRIVDPGDRLLARWRTCTATTGMSHLRSPAVHHLDLDPWSLEDFADQWRSREREIFAPPYNRPALALFNEHCDKVVETFGLADLHIQDRATRCAVGCDGVNVQLSTGREIAAQNLVLAIGASEQPEWPDWAPRNHPRIRHVFEPKFDGWPSSNETVVVIGGGISAGQVALRLLDEGHLVHLVSRHALRQHQFDSDPGWLGPKFMESFSSERDFDRRRTLIIQARHKGSVPPDVRRALGRAIDEGQLLWHEDEVEKLDVRRDGLVVSLATHAELEAERVLLATGFASPRPGGRMVDSLVAWASLPCARCGYPIVDSALRWHPRVYVSGPLAELELGPASRNIAGARRAGDRLVDAAWAS
ncbi:MAG: FAD/NAD(P)-binding protein [Thermoanaerobaculia bacterium]|nr:FAD/NAD(P)-binding protein [Thermoanaerobaculia bacterium]